MDSLINSSIISKRVLQLKILTMMFVMFWHILFSSVILNARVFSSSVRKCSYVLSLGFIHLKNSSITAIKLKISEQITNKNIKTYSYESSYWLCPYFYLLIKQLSIAARRRTDLSWSQKNTSTNRSTLYSVSLKKKKRTKMKMQKPTHRRNKSLHVAQMLCMCLANISTSHWEFCGGSCPGFCAGCW